MQLIKFAQNNNIMLIPFGGGTSVVGGVNMIESTYRGAITVVMDNFDKVFEVDETSLCINVGAGIFGPELNRILLKKGLTLRYFPQSFEFSTVGGWIATRGGGHYATGKTHIDDMVQSVRVVTPAGIIDTSRYPASGAGPDSKRLFIGSEGIFGFITSAWIQVQRIVKYKVSQTVNFNSFMEGVKAVQDISQSGIYPTNCRLIDPLESMAMGLSTSGSACLILGFESATIGNLSVFMNPLLEICKTHGGSWSYSYNNKDNKPESDWKGNFLEAPYYRDELMLRGVSVETFETCTTWSNFPNLYNKITQELNEAIIQLTGSPGIVTCRFTHVYPDGPAPYFTVGFKGLNDDHWNTLKKIASDILVANGGTITHHHAVGRDHASHFRQQSDAMYIDLLEHIKNKLDPYWVLNPEVLIKQNLQAKY
eukprot:TRINITY_DN249_c0_g1_i1.p1 TRINITY_DN249_c0_g1~~TRINITY_DN249_c0_g1_i1.p1  ORF type:complete len:423 (-),score=72.30 TRINITY_DN249_c0_g1_i1:27-1295(-)